MCEQYNDVNVYTVRTYKFSFNISLPVHEQYLGTDKERTYEDK